MENKTQPTHKVCSKCKGDPKPIADFHYDKTHKRHRADCRKCHSAVISKNYHSLTVEEKRLRNSTSFRKTEAKFLELYGASYNSMHTQNRRDFNGEYKCSVCGETENIEFHILDYNNPTVFIQACRSCHKEIHIQLRRDLHA